MELPITDSEFDYILELVRHKNPQLYNKLWSHKFNLKYIKNKK